MYSVFSGAFQFNRIENVYKINNITCNCVFKMFGYRLHAIPHRTHYAEEAQIFNKNYTVK